MLRYSPEPVARNSFAFLSFSSLFLDEAPENFLAMLAEQIERMICTGLSCCCRALHALPLRIFSLRQHFNFVLHQGVFLAEVFHLICQPGNHDAELYRQQHQENNREQEQCRRWQARTDQSGQINQPFNTSQGFTASDAQAVLPPQGVIECSIPGNLRKNRPPEAMIRPSLLISPALVSSVRPASLKPVTSAL